MEAARILQRLLGDKKREATASSVVAMIDEVAEILGNTRTICRKYYIHPSITSAYLDGTLTQSLATSSPGSAAKGLSLEEAAVLRFLKGRGNGKMSG